MKSKLSLLILGVLCLSACGSVNVPSGPDATNELCAQLIVSLPNEVLGQKRVETNAQATAAWGKGEDIVVFRCGVTPPPPTEELCTTIETRSGIQIDWIVQVDEASDSVLFTTYGRIPAVDISVPRSLAPDQPSAAAIELSALVAQIEQTGGRCLAFYDT